MVVTGTGDLALENVYTLHLTNKSDLPQRFAFSLSGLDGAAFATAPETIELGAREKRQIPIRIQAPEAVVKPGVNSIDITATRLANDRDNGDVSSTTRARFFAPFE